MPVEQPSDQLGSLLQVLLLDGIHPDIGEVGFNAIKHPRQRHIERKKRMIEIGRVQFGSWLSRRFTAGRHDRNQYGLSLWRCVSYFTLITIPDPGA